MSKIAVFFDLDGTLLNTIGDIANTCNHIMRENGYPEHSVEDYKHMVGNGFSAMIQKAIYPAPVPSNLEELVADAREYYGKHMTENTFPYPGMNKILQEMMEKNAVLGVLSNKPDNLTVELVRHFFPEIEFAAVAGAKPGVPLKPDPEFLLSMFRQAGLENVKRFYTGDSDVDIETAKNAQIFGVGAAWGFRGRMELENAGADIILEKPQDLLEIFNIR